jgi:hypothetical protein
MKDEYSIYVLLVILVFYFAFISTMHRAKQRGESREGGGRHKVLLIYDGVPKSFRTESITKYMLTKINIRCEATQRVMAVKLTILTHKIVTQLHLVAESRAICSSRCRRQSGNFWIHPRILTASPHRLNTQP